MQTMSEITKLSKRVMAEETPNFVYQSPNATILEESVINPYSNGNSKSALTFGHKDKPELVNLKNMMSQNDIKVKRNTRKMGDYSAAKMRKIGNDYNLSVDEHATPQKRLADSLKATPGRLRSNSKKALDRYNNPVNNAAPGNLRAVLQLAKGNQSDTNNEIQQILGNK
jgi:hypothetical protein